MTEKQIVSVINSCARPRMYFGLTRPHTILAFYNGIDIMCETPTKALTFYKADAQIKE